MYNIYTAHRLPERRGLGSFQGTRSFGAGKTPWGRPEPPQGMGPFSPHAPQPGLGGPKEGLAQRGGEPGADEQASVEVRSLDPGLAWLRCSVAGATLLTRCEAQFPLWQEEGAQPRTHL